MSVSKLSFSKDLHDELLRRLAYVKYVDDFIFSFTETKVESNYIKGEIEEYFQVIYF
jgi:hypothetical protein